ncbi:hypothetical protein L873DRAFT_1838463 [Choiromyces venosus 120613-1]|uniref:GYF domain-containing protein n=1 Tax=Choiromyces venosus 120613-1 TaxID=1336337 RepID=A0A3N4J4Q6_9PEZI|nr:hypothetical protein L873DRAFT_1838463 [Choiromyces venosus 120613-1]
MSTSSHFASSFSTAAGGGKDGGINTTNNSGTSSTSGGGGGGGGSSDWSRRANGTSNSAHRRPSLSTTLSHPTSQHSQPPLTPSTSNVYHPPHHFNRSGVGNAVNTTYGRDDLLGIFKAQEQNGTLREVKDLMLGDLSSGSGGGGWGRGGDEAGGAEVCWDKEGGLKPVSLEDMNEEERELFASNVNSPHKAPPNQNNQGAMNHHNTNHTPPQNRNKITAPPGTGTPNANRPTNRRRETSDAVLTSLPFNSTPPQMPRRRTELRDEEQTREGGGRDRTLFGRWGSTSGTSGQTGDDDHGKEKSEDGSGSGGRGSGLFRRGSTPWGPGGSTGGGGFASSALNSPMGTFGNGAFGGAMGGFSLQSASSEKLKASGGAGNTGQKGSTAQPKVEEEDEQAENAQRPRSSNINELREEHERERPMSSDTDPFGLGEGGGDHEHDQRQEQQQQHSPLPTPGLDQRMKDNSFNMASNTQTRQGNSVSTPTKVRSDLGFSGIGTTRDGSNIGGLHQQLQNLQLNQQGHFPLHGRSREGSIGGIIGGLHENEPLSPTETNPYQSPAPEKADDDDMPENGGGGGIIGGFRRSDVGAPGSDRSGRSSTAGLGSGIGSGLASFSSLSGGTLWGGTSGSAGLGNNTAPSSFFGSSMLNDLNSPNTIGSGGPFSAGGIGGMGSIGGGGFGSASRASRLGQLFQQEPQMEEEQQPQQPQQGGFDSNDAFGDLRFGNAFGSGRSGFGSAVDSPMRERPVVMDIFNLHTTRSLGNIGAAASGENTLYPRDRDDPLPSIHSLHQNQPVQPAPLSAGIQPPAVQQPPQIRPPPGTVAPQQHVMVMPDKIQWTYRDPSGTVQGPFSGLEMHDWYKAGFFTQDLAVKRVEDPEFEQLGNLVRRIGNTREPFLVPLQAPANSTLVQTTTSQPNTWPGVAVSSSWLNENQQPPQTAGTVQPPFAGSFPSFGTTLTADQQNALERRKQEEQYLLARQREYLVQQQVFAKAQHALQHQHSQQSLHSQPSFGSLQGSLQSPGGFGTPVTATTVGIGGQNSFEPGVLLRQAGAAAGGADAFGVGAGQQLPQNSQFAQQQQQVQADRLQMEQQQRMLEMQRQQIHKAYQTQHQQVEKQQELQQAQQQAAAAVVQAQQHAQSYETHHNEREDERSPQEAQERGGTVPSSAWGPQAPEQPKVSIPKAASSTKTSPRPTQAQTTSSHEWEDSEPALLVQPFPPPAGSHSTSMARSPSNETPQTSASASDNEVKQPSLTLKEIQEIEAEQQRNREAFEAEQRPANQPPPPPPAPGLPSTATWATSPSTTPATGSASAWAKPLVKANTIPTTGAKKTLSQIQKEEEARKAKAAALVTSTAQAAAQIPSAPLAGGKRYADLATWTTVGPGGKSKLGAGGPAGPLPSTPTAPAQPLRTISSTIAVAPVKPAATSAEGEFHKWAMASLTGLKEGVKANELLAEMLNFPLDASLIADTIYDCSTTMDGRRFAAEFIRRKEAARIGVVIEAGSSNGGGAGGWNEVAKGKANTQQAAKDASPETNAAFKVVAGKKKGRR